eukprot:scaffold323_cov232-Pinguiococcus_pyrenoidosus.AAC.13
MQELSGCLSTLELGPAYNFPMGADGVPFETYKELLKEAQQTVGAASSILIVGGGPVGVEMAGEIKAAHPDKDVTIVNSGTKLLSAAVAPLNDRLVTSIMRQLEALGVRVVLGARLAEIPPPPEGPVKTAIRPTPGATFALSNGESVSADLVFVATGPSAVKPAGADLLPEGAVDGSTGLIKVNEYFLVDGMDGVFAIGDCTNIRETKMGAPSLYFVSLLSPWCVQVRERGRALSSFPCLLATLRSLAYAPPEKQKLNAYTPPDANSAAMFVPLGPRRGASAMGSTVLGPRMTSLAKGKGLLTGMLMKERGLAPPPLET